MPTNEPSVTLFEQAVSDAADQIMEVGKTGYAWGPVDDLLKKELELEGITRCKQAKGSGRAANVLTESNDKVIELYVIFIGAPYTIEQFRTSAIDRVKRFPNVKTVAVADRVSGVWRVREFIERDDVELAVRVMKHFPLVAGSNIHLVHAEFANDPGSTSSIPQVDPEIFRSYAESVQPKVDSFNELVTTFTKTAKAVGVAMMPSTAIDVLAVVLSSQLVLFAGPSGTGKSTIARFASSFFSDASGVRVIECRRQWIAPEDLSGYYSPIAGTFVTTPDTFSLVDLHEASVENLRAHEDGTGTTPVIPFLILEEMNLSPPEGYLAPLIHGLSSTSVSCTSWMLHETFDGANAGGSNLNLPSTLLFGPHPRVIGTINVDTTAPAPARKVVARSSVILLEPEALTVGALVDLVAEEPESSDAWHGEGAPWLGDPAAIRRTMPDDAIAALLRQLRNVVSIATTGKPAEPDSSLRLNLQDVERSLNYMAAFVTLAVAQSGGNVTDYMQIAAENSLLHLVLPSLSPEQFPKAVEAFQNSGALTKSSGGEGLGGLLMSRLENLASTLDAATLYDVIDFWTSLT